MYCLMLTPGGLLIMMGQHARSEALFYYFTLEEYIPQNHLLRLIDKHIDSVLFASSSGTATAIRGGPRWIPNCCFASC